MSSADETPSMATLTERRDALECSLDDVAGYLADHDYYDLARSTLSGRLGQWERGDANPSDEDRKAVRDALDTIEAEQNYTHPACSASECNNDEPAFEPETIDGEPYCLVCYYSSAIEPPQNSDPPVSTEEES